MNTIASVSQHTEIKPRRNESKNHFSCANQIHMLGLYSAGLIKEIPACRCKAIPWLSYELAFSYYGLWCAWHFLSISFSGNVLFL